jgi:hypothetical protein
MSGYTSGNKAPTLMAQAPNRVGNKSKTVATGSGGVTAVTRPQGGVAYSVNHQGPASAGKSATSGRGQKVMVNRPSADYCHNDSYRSSSYLK